MNNFIKSRLKENIKISEDLLHQVELIKRLGKIIVDAFENDQKLLIAGNGGSAADAQHFAAELIYKFKKQKKTLPVIALTTNSSILTAISNDDSFNNVFSYQIEALAKKNDVFCGISTSGNSQNIINALRVAKKRGCKTLGLTGKMGGKMKKYCDVSIGVNSQDTHRIQEAHISIIHILCELIREAV